MTHTVRSIARVALVALVCAVAATPLLAQATSPADARLAREQVASIPMGATVEIRMRSGERLKAVLFSADEAGVRVKPATRIPEPSRRIEYDQIDSIERHQDHVSVGKYVGIGSAMGAVVLFLLVAGV
jgi:hypothetical protein